MTSHTGSATGKIILSGEYAVVFGYPGIAVPSPYSMTVTWTESPEPLTVQFANGETPDWAKSYMRKIIGLCEEQLKRKIDGNISIRNSIPLGKGMGSSTALVIALSRALLGPDCEAAARAIEDTVNPGHSGLDFAVIWNARPVLFRKGKPPELIDLPQDLLKHSTLIDTGSPNETTAELVAWMKTREEEIRPALEIIGRCTERLKAGEDLMIVMRDHHKAQLALGVVRPEAAKIIADIEAAGCAGKVLGAGARTGGGGMVLTIRTGVDR